MLRLRYWDIIMERVCTSKPQNRFKEFLLPGRDMIWRSAAEEIRFDKYNNNWIVLLKIILLCLRSLWMVFMENLLRMLFGNSRIFLDCHRQELLITLLGIRSVKSMLELAGLRSWIEILDTTKAPQSSSLWSFFSFLILFTLHQTPLFIKSNSITQYFLISIFKLFCIHLCVDLI